MIYEFHNWKKSNIYIYIYIYKYHWQCNALIECKIKKRVLTFSN